MPSLVTSAVQKLKRMLLLRWQHGLDPYAIFINLVKALDTVHQDLLCAILEKYKLPSALVQNNAKL
jgi:hypothetical protein